MNIFRARLPTIVGLLVLGVGIAAGIYVVNSRRVVVDMESYQPSAVRITNVADNKFSVSWVTDTAMMGRVIYGKVGEEIAQVAVDDRDTLGGGVSGNYTTHHISVEGLQPNTQYAFRIESGEEGVVYDDGGRPYIVTTGPVLTTTPPANSVYGEVRDQASLPAEGALVYLAIPGSVPLSTLVKSSGNWTVGMSTARTSDLLSYIEFDPKATVISISVESGKQQASATVNTANSAPVPLIVLGESYDFRQAPAVAQEVESEVEASESADTGGEEVTIAEISDDDFSDLGVFNVAPLGDEADADTSVVILNPADEGEILATQRPDFRGTGPSGVELSILVGAKKTYSGLATVEADGTWSWSPTGDLDIGANTITITYQDTEGDTRATQRNFYVIEGGDFPAFEATPSGGTTPSPSPTPTPSPNTGGANNPSPSPSLSPSPSASASGSPKASASPSPLPQAGILELTAGTVGIGIILIILGLIGLLAI